MLLAPNVEKLHSGCSDIYLVELNTAFVSYCPCPSWNLKLVNNWPSNCNGQLIYKRRKLSNSAIKFLSWWWNIWIKCNLAVQFLWYYSNCHDVYKTYCHVTLPIESWIFTSCCFYFCLINTNKTKFFLLNNDFCIAIRSSALKLIIDHFFYSYAVETRVTVFF